MSATEQQFQKPLGPFAVLYEQRTPEAPVKKRRSGWQRILAQRAKDGIAKTNTEKVLRKNAYSEVGLSTRGAGDRAASIRKTAI